MELLLFFLIVAVGGVWWLNYTINKKAQSDAKADLEKQETEAPYKVDIVEEKVAVSPSVETAMAEAAVQPTKCGCGRSPTGFCVGLHKLTAEEWSVHADNPNKVEPMVETKKARKPRATKPAKVEAVAEIKKSRGRKPASAKKVTVKKSASKKS